MTALLADKGLDKTNKLFKNQSLLDEHYGKHGQEIADVLGEKKEIEQGTTIAKLIEIEKVENPEYVTVTVNDEFLNRADFETTQGKENDTIEFLYFMGGGAF